MSAVKDEHWAEHVSAVLGREGHRRGGARDAIVDLLASQECALTVLEMEDALRRRRRRIGRASVYRILELLADYGLVQRIDLGEGVTRYEPARPGGEHHHHLLCARCQRLVPFSDPALERAIAGLPGRLGFRVRDHEVVLHGACEQCALPETASAGRIRP
ncbi:MAG TPA: transcriptional repressor [Solirubrobacteraceae bacterium]|nr:transcriptional repressor [Solirubrobacteraceae bacterium]